MEETGPSREGAPGPAGAGNRSGVAGGSPSPGPPPEPRTVRTAAAAASIARETAGALAARCTLGVLAYPATVLTSALVTPGIGRRLWFVLPWGLLVLLSVVARLAWMLPFDRRYSADPRRWLRNFRAGLIGTLLLWLVYALEETIANGSSWPAWMILLMSAGMAAGATTSLCPDPPLLYGYLPLLLVPFIGWGVAQGGASGYALAVVVAVYLIFIAVQGRHACQVFRQAALDKEALREAGRRRDALVNSIDGIVWEADLRSQRFLFVSRRAEAILGYPAERWLAEPSFWQDHVHPDDLPGILARILSETEAGRNYTLEYRMLAADGRAVWLRDIVRCGEGDGGFLLRGVMVDITAGRQAGEQRNMLANALRAVREGVAIFDLEGRILFVNDAFLALHGYTREEVQSAHIGLLHGSRNTPELLAAIAAGTRRGGWQGELWSRRKDGSEFPVSLSTSLLRDAAGRTVAQIGVSTDITGRKRMEEEWKRAKEAAEAASRAKSEFLANLSHEIRTPMNGIVGMNHLLLDTTLDRRQRRFAEAVRDSAGFLLSVLNDILDFSRIESGSFHLEEADFDLHAIAAAVVDLLAAPAQAKAIELLCRIDGDVPTRLRGDPGRVRQALANLAGNAVKFTEAGEVSIRIRLESAGPPAVLRFEVADTGIGVPPEKRRLLFQPFSQVDGSSTRRHGGAGLGLTIVSRLAAMMGGEAGFASREGGGSRFWFTASLALQPSQPAPLPLAGRRVLAVDPSPANRALLAGILGDWGVRAQTAADGDAALALLGASAEPFDAVLVDSAVVWPATGDPGLQPSDSAPFRPMAPRASKGDEGGAGDSPALAPHAHAAASGELGKLKHAPPSTGRLPGKSTVLAVEDLAGTPLIRMVPFRERLHSPDAVSKPLKQAELGQRLARLFQPVEPGSAAALERTRPESRASRARLLLVEDNPTNQELSVGILEQLGYAAVQVAANGQQALEAMAAEDFDLVLMDCQMPVMDGYEATRRIRHGSAPVRHPQLPIVAMTAHALAGDRDRCLDAGMDDYLAKPIDPKTLQAVLARWLPLAGPSAEPGLPPAEGEAAPWEREILRSAAFDQIAEGVVVTDAQACIQYVNESFTRMTGYAPEEVLGRNPRLLQSGRQGREYYQRMWETLQAGQVWRGEIVDRRKDGSEYAEEIVIAPVRNPQGAITNYVAVKADAAARQAGENAWRTLAAIVESSEDAILSHTPEGVITSWNRGAGKVFGYTAREVLGQPVTMLAPPGQAGHLRAALERLRAGEAILHYESVGYSKDRRKIHLSTSSSPVYDASGQVISIAVVVRDVTARKQGQDALREREEQFRTLFTDAPVGIARVSLDGYYLQVNATFCRIVGYSEEELTGKNWSELTLPEEIQRCDEFRRDLLENRRPRVEFEKRYLHKQGHPVLVRLSISLVGSAEGGPRYFIMHAEDLDQSRRAQEALQAFEERYRLLFARSVAAVLRTTLSGQVLDCNQAAAALLGFDNPSQLKGRDLAEFHDSLEARERTVEALKTHKMVANAEFKLRRRDGTPLWALSNVALVDEATGGFLEETLVDITDRKLAEEHLREAKEMAERADRAKSAFLANMSHEIRTPMNGILGMAGLLLEGELEPRQRKRAETVRDSAEALLAILNDILDISKMEAGKLKLEDAPFDLRKLVEGVADMMAVRAQEKGVEMICFIEPDVSTQLRGDSSRLRQVLVNLAGNAVKFTSEGEVSIRVKPAQPGDSERIRFEVSDTGAGIPEGKRHLLFQPFSQIDSSSARRYGGTGLGLSIVRTLVRLMGGEVGFESQDGRGSRFWFTVPLERQSTALRPRPLSLAGRRILVVDDNAASRGLIMELLAFWRARGEQAAGPAEAAELLTGPGHPFDAIVVDLDTLEPQCEEFPAMVRQHRRGGRAALLLMVPLSQAADGERWNSLGFEGHTAKPVKQGEMGACLASLLGYGLPPVRPAPEATTPKTDRAERSRLRLLLVEDNQVNQEVALGVLENLGYRAEVVGDGRSALDALRRQDYDLVLMDCYLPGMDGYEASRLIRRRDTDVRNHEIPIVATTANAMAGDREKCLAAGMNGYVSKPLRSEELEQAIEEWTGGAPSALPLAAALPTPAANPAAAPAFDREDFLGRVMGNQNLANRILRRFLSDMPGQLALLAEAVSAGDPQQVRLHAHSIKGAAASVGGVEIREAAWRLEQQATAGDLSSAHHATPELRATFERAKPAMEGFCDEEAD